MHERQDLGEARGKSETEKARQNLESEVLVRLNRLSEMSGLRPRSRDGRKSWTVTALQQHELLTKKDLIRDGFSSFVDMELVSNIGQVVLVLQQCGMKW